MTEHLSKRFDSELDTMRAHLARMGGLVEDQVRTALKAFAEADRELADGVIVKDRSVDEMEIQIDDDCAHLIARRQPTAIDLRVVMAVGKTVTDLERIGDEAKKIARITVNILERGISQGLTQLADVRHMGEQATRMLHDVLAAFVRLDVATAARVVREDKDVDQHFRAVVRHLITYMMEDPRTISTAIDVIFISKAIERIGDHCKNIGEDIIYIVKGRDVRHIGLESLEREAQSR